MKGMLAEMAEEPRDRESWAGAAVEEMEEDRALKLLEGGARVLGYGGLDEVGGMDRYLLGRLARERTKVRVAWLAGKLGVKTREGMSHMLSRIGREIEKDAALGKRWKMLHRSSDSD